MKTQIFISAFDQEEWLHNKPMICNDCGENQSDGRKPDSHVVLKDQEGPDPGTFLLWGGRGATPKTISHKKERCRADIQDHNTLSCDVA